MNFNFHVVLILLAVICFVLDAARAPIPRCNLTALGLAILALSFLVIR